MRRWLWLRFTRDGRDERRAAQRYQAMLDRGRRSPQHVAALARIRQCYPHPNRLPNERATALDPAIWRGETCADCGAGIVTRLPAS